jgi:hypothetical protein
MPLNRGTGIAFKKKEEKTGKAFVAYRFFVFQLDMQIL